MNLVLGKLLVESRGDMIQAGEYYQQFQWQEFYQLPANSLDLVTIGSSLCLYGIDPAIISQETGLSNFNFGSAAQPITASYYILKEVLKYHKIKYVVFEVNYERLTQTLVRPYKVYIFDNMKLSWNKLDYFIRGFSLSEKTAYLLPMLEKKKSMKYVINKLLGRRVDQFHLKEHYAGRGFLSSDEVLDIESIKHQEYKWFDSEIMSEARDYYARIVQLVQAENAQLIVVNLPYFQLAKTVNEEFREEYLDFMQLNKEVIVYDFLAQSEEYSAGEYFDRKHLNHLGARHLTHDLAARIAGLGK